MPNNVKSIKPGTTYAAVLGQILARRRAAVGLDQTELAKALGVTQSSWSRIESGQTVLSVEQLKQVAVRLKTTPDTLLSEADKAEDYLKARGVTVVSTASAKSNDVAMALLVGTALGLLLVGLFKKGK